MEKATIQTKRFPLIPDLIKYYGIYVLGMLVIGWGLVFLYMFQLFFWSLVSRDLHGPRHDFLCRLV